ncbi:MAG TPA: response regulator, partial [Polyangiaceae bacterium]|nr:response regulator [Polyangiaceae bacterium]
MSTKVLVFESDKAFANELVFELGRLDCEVSVVDDGNQGLQLAAADRPDLVLLSIELPRMNGFSVCNKLKKDPLLREVPLIIMSSESSDETFEQHRKLRTRAEDYVHKPIAFADLLDRIRALVAIGPGEGGDSLEDAIVIDDEIAYDDSADAGAMTVEPLDTVPPSNSPSPFDGVDPDVERFAEDAFDRLMDSTGVSPAVDFSGAPVEPPPPSRPAPTGSVRPPARSVRPPAAVVDTVELDRARAELDRSRAEVDQVRTELERYRSETVRLERELVTAQSEAQRL